MFVVFLGLFGAFSGRCDKFLVVHRLCSRSRVVGISYVEIWGQFVDFGTTGYWGVLVPLEVKGHIGQLGVEKQGASPCCPVGF